MLRQRSRGIEILDESDHGLVANRVELKLCARLNVGDELPVVDIAVQRVRRHILFDFVLKICQKSQIILKLHHKGLIVHGLPGPLYGGIVTLSEVRILTESGFSRKIGPNHYLPEVFVVEGPFVVLAQNLYFVWMLVGADLVSIKQIERLIILAHMEVPNLVVNLLPQTRNRLICCT